VQKIELDLISTLLVSIAVFFLGRALVGRLALLKRFSVPAPVVGGGLMAVVLAILTGGFGTAVSFNMSLKDSLLLVAGLADSTPSRRGALWARRRGGNTTRPDATAGE
jgi:sodium--glutamate symport carrier gltS